ncbi:MAG: 23S rRNA (uracil(1939)-C(5))-methyltransferase RlmD [Gammaproteobacteria bacterium]|nr:23S rRNA (uracil(1939)-C(5))-methyltransferase RlmD [Gammaproteobacteria bacterium]
MSNPIVEITALSHEGRGIAHLDNKTVFIEGALPNEKVEFIYTKKHRHFDEGRVEKILEASSERVQPRCPHYGVCGGCSQQHFSHALQIQNKQKVLLDSLNHIGKVNPQYVLPPLLGPEWGYRHKARLGVKYVEKKQKLLIGFREKQGRYLADLNSCDVLHPAIGKEIESLRSLLWGLKKYRAIPQLEVAIGDEMIALVVRHLEPLPEEDIQKLLIFSKEKNIKIYLQSAGTESVFLLKNEASDEEDYLFYRLPEFDLTLFFHPMDFTQVNPAINRQLVALAVHLLELKSSDRVIDFFCGLGNFTLPIARTASQVVGVEGAKVMVERACMNAERNAIHHASFYTANLMGALSHEPWFGHYDKVLLDPPRTGAIELIQQISFTAERIVYVSCNPATLARDAAHLVQHQGYQLTHAGVMDMFPHTSHVESIAVFQK